MKRNSANQENDLPETPGHLQKIPRGGGDPSIILSYDRASTSPVQWGAFQHIVVL